MFTDLELGLQNMKEPLGRVPQGRAVGQRFPCSESCGQRVSSSRSQTSEVGRSIAAKSFFPDPALSHSSAQTQGEFMVRKYSACPAATRKETASHSNPQRLQPCSGADHLSALLRLTREERDCVSSVFFTPVCCWNQDERPVCCFIFLIIFFWPRSVACRIRAPRLGMEPMPPALEVQLITLLPVTEVPVSCFELKVSAEFNPQ